MNTRYRRDPDGRFPGWVLEHLRNDVATGRITWVAVAVYVKRPK
jgi:hypothetical protein